MKEAIENTSQIHFTSSKLSTRDYIPVAHYSKHLYNFDSSKFLSKSDMMFDFMLSYLTEYHIWQNIRSREYNTSWMQQYYFKQCFSFYSTCTNNIFISITSINKNNLQLPPGWILSCFIEYKYSKNHAVGDCIIFWRFRYKTKQLKLVNKV